MVVVIRRHPPTMCGVFSLGDPSWGNPPKNICQGFPLWGNSSPQGQKPNPCHLPPPVLVWCFRRPFVGCEIGPGLIGLGGMRLPNFSSVPPSGAVDPPWDESYLPITTIYLIWGWRCCPMAGTNFGLGALYREVSCEIFVRSTSSGSLSSPRFDCIQPNTPPILLS